MPNKNTPAFPGPDHVVLDLEVRNHPGVMSHVCGLFARRAFNVEGIFCLPVGDGSTSRILLCVGQNQRLDQLEVQLGKLHDVYAVRRSEQGLAPFTRLGQEFQDAAVSSSPPRS